MLRTLAVAAIVVTAPLGALAIADQTVLEDVGTIEPVTVSQDGETVDVTDDALPGSTGWFVLPVSTATDQQVEIRIWENMSRDQGSDEIQGQGLILDLPGYDHIFHGWVDRPHATATVHHDNTTERCCPELTQQIRAPFDADDGEDDGGYGPILPLHAGETLHVGLAADGWDPSQSFHIRVEGLDAPLEIGQLSTGTAVEAIDLVQEARENGTVVLAGDRTVAGDHGEAHLSWDAEGTTLFSVDVWAEGDTQAKARLELPNGTVIDNGDGRNQSFWAIGSSGPGDTSLSLTDLEAENLAEELLAPGGSGWVGATALVAQIDLTTTALEVHRWPETPLPAEGSVDVSDEMLPGEDGWFLVPIHADGHGHLELQHIAEANATEHSKAFVPLIMTERHPLRGHGANVMPVAPAAEASAAGQAVACCQADGRTVGTSWSAGSSGQGSVPISPESPVYLGLVAVGWDDEDRFELRAHAEEVNITLGDVQAGTSVQAIDLVDEAYDQGTAVQLGGRETGQASDLEQTLSFEEGGLVLTDHWIEGQAQGKLSLELADGTTADNGDGRETEGQIHALTGPGEITIRFTDVEQPQPQLLAGQHDSVLEATVLIADIPLPFQDLLVDVDETG